MASVKLGSGAAFEQMELAQDQIVAEAQGGGHK